MARSEYSQLRGIAQKRLERLAEHGLAMPGLSFPKVSELKTAEQKTAALESLKSFLQSGTTIKEALQTPEKKIYDIGGSPAFLTEKQKKEAERRERRNEKRRERYAQKKDELNRKRRERYARKKELSKLTDKQRALIKGAETLGLKIPTDKIQSFIEYMELRFSQVRESQFYAMATYTEDYEQIMKKGHAPDDIAADFARFLNDRDSVIGSVPENAYSESAVNALWKEYADGLG